MALFENEYLKVDGPYKMIKHAFHEETVDGDSLVTFFGTIQHTGSSGVTTFSVSGDGNGPIDAFFNAIKGEKMNMLSFVDYKSHAISVGSDSVAVAYVQLRDDNGNDIFGVGTSHNINVAPLRAIVCAINRYKKQLKEQA